MYGGEDEDDDLLGDEDLFSGVDPRIKALDDKISKKFEEIGITNMKVINPLRGLGPAGAAEIASLKKKRDALVSEGGDPSPFDAQIEAKLLPLATGLTPKIEDEIENLMAHRDALIRQGVTYRYSGDEEFGFVFFLPAATAALTAAAIRTRKERIATAQRKLRRGRPLSAKLTDHLRRDKQWIRNILPDVRSKRKVARLRTELRQINHILKSVGP
jgi:hypothetical protein